MRGYYTIPGFAAHQDNVGSRLRFIVRHPEYNQRIGYGYFLQHVLTELNKNPARNAQGLMEQTAELMLNPSRNHSVPHDPSQGYKDIDVLTACLPRALRGQLLKQLDGVRPGDHEDIEARMQPYFGEVANAYFGVLSHKDIEYSRTCYEAYQSGGSAHVMKLWGLALPTNIGTKDNNYRAYFETLVENQGLDPENIPQDLNITFDYPIPGTNKRMPLMKIAYCENLLDDVRSRYQGDVIAIEEEMVGQFTENFAGSLMFLHPNGNAEHFCQLSRCLDPLLATIDKKPDTRPAEHTPPPLEKQDALITAYWLLAQSTPVVRGGSAFANVIREHLSERLREQGYEYDVPYAKAGVDMWAQAVTQSLEAFKDKYKSGQFFDPKTRPQSMEDYLLKHLQRTPKIDDYLTEENKRRSRQYVMEHVPGG